ncbi:MAG: hypothetical protein ACD_38C00064G0002 [uncultured bacterium]|uniref:Uncharacterized protein n=1 Tax=Candidatus Daviesbacteria bacterium RIFCSPHIGHO2_01_FULL_40_11 TaxID=1797762 RepID=A0A1F5JKV2_9BACT|nr:MAG: hypothetical protein ACD_38C00064G0002 [uncultured bacterium]OGE29090.1 MAG: hypothetical protein A2867_01165 [Candidatus Daviesbacteria bacterium RIFCSPHIGHO2_01_FULL_40_11]OGE62877.1 MAG: hypothetical protein A2964_01245 [Candidatus Daviesbacteria bacterium RIFCSPLOWO2_01_FULL_40_27]
MASAEKKHAPSYRPEGFSILDSVSDHTMLGPIFAILLVSHPRRALNILIKEGPKGIANGYRKFFNNTRPVLYFRPPKQ